MYSRADLEFIMSFDGVDEELRGIAIELFEDGKPLEALGAINLLWRWEILPPELEEMVANNEDIPLSETVERLAENIQQRFNLNKILQEKIDSYRARIRNLMGKKDYSQLENFAKEHAALFSAAWLVNHGPSIKRLYAIHAWMEDVIIMDDRMSYENEINDFFEHPLCVRVGDVNPGWFDAIGTAIFE